MTTEFVVPAVKRCVIEQRIARIQDVFDVGVRLCDPAADGDGEASRSDSGCVLQGPQTAEREPNINDNVTSTSDPGLASGNVWVYIDGQDADNCQRAKEHIVSLCTESSVEEACPLAVEPNMLDKRITCWEYESGAVIERLPGDRLRIQGPDENIIRAQSLISMETVSPSWDGREQRCTSSDGDISLQNGAIWRNDSTRTNTASPGADPGNFSNSSNSPRDFSDSVNGPRTNFLGSRSSPRLDSSHSAGIDMVDGRRGFITPQQGHQGTTSVPSLSSSASSSALIGRGTAPPQQDRLQERAVPSLSSSSSAPSLSTSSSVSSSSPGKHEEIIAWMQKLGYSRQMVEQVILQIGEHASSNEVLQMLMSQGSLGMEQDDAAGSANRSGNGSGSRTSSAKDASDGVEDTEDKDADPYRAVIIDGSNVAMSYGNKNVFACKGIDTVVMWFLKRGHKVIYVFVPSWRKEQSKPETPIQDQEVLIELEKARILVWTPSRRVKGRRMVCYDDRYILNLAIELDGIIVSNDTFRDLCAEKPEYQKVVEEHLLMYSFAGEKFMPPDDPLGRNGPNLDNFLRKTPSKPAHQMQPCPYGKKCTYGNKCKYGHPERSKNQRPMSEILLEKDRQRKEKRIITELHARALNRPDPIQMRLEREVAEEDVQAGVIPGRGMTDPLGYPNPSPRGADRNTFPGHAQVQPHLDSAATFPLMNPSRPETNLTVPLSQQQMASVHQLQRLEDVTGGGNGGVYRARGGSALPVARGLVSHQNYHQQPFLDSRLDGHPDQRVMSGFHHPSVQPALRPMHSVQRRGQQLPDRTSLTAPISYTPRHHQALQEQHLTAPLTGPQEPLQYHNPGHRHSMPLNHRDVYAPGPQHPSNFARDGNPPLPQFGTEGNTSSHFARNVNAAVDLLPDFGQMSLREPSRSSVFEEERHHTFPLTNPHRSSPGPARHTSELSQSSMSLATDDEGYFSPRYPIEQTVASPLPGQQTATQGYPPHQGSDTRHPQSHAYQFNYPNSSSNHNHAPAPQSGWSQQQSKQGSNLVPQPMGRMEPQVGRMEPQVGRLEPQVGRLEPQVGRLESQVGRPEPHAGRPEPHAGRPEPHVGHWGMHQGHGQQAMAPPQHSGEPPMVPRAGWLENDNHARMPEYRRNPQNQL